MNSQCVYSRVPQVKLGEASLKILSVQVLLISLIVGVSFRSWAIGVAMFMFLLPICHVVASNGKLIDDIALGLALIWAAVVFMTLAVFCASTFTALAMASLAGMVSGGMNSAAFQHLKGIYRAKAY